MESTIRGVTHLQKEEDWDPKNLINIRFFPQKISKLQTTSRRKKYKNPDILRMFYKYNIG